MYKLATRLISIVFVISVIIGCQKQDNIADPVIPDPEITKKYLKKTTTSNPGQPIVTFNYNYNNDGSLTSSYAINIDGDTISKFIYLYNNNNKLSYMLYSFTGHSYLDTISYNYSGDTVIEYWHTNGNNQISSLFLRNDQGEDYYMELYDRNTGELTNKYTYIWDNRNLVEAVVESLSTSIIDTYTFTYYQGIMNPMIDSQMTGYRDSQNQVSTVKKNGVIMTNESYILLDQANSYPYRVRYGDIEYYYEYY